MSSIRKPLLAGVLVLGLALYEVAAQDRRPPFETLDVGIGVFTDVNHSMFHEYWNPGLGLEVFLGMPIYLGAVQLGVQQFQNDNRLSSVPEFRSRFFYLGWDHELRLGSRAVLRNGIQLGAFHMRYDIDSGSVSRDRSETEFGLGATSGLQYALAPRWNAGLTGRYQLVVTHERIRRLLFGIYLSRQFTTPAWLRAFLD